MRIFLIAVLLLTASFNIFAQKKLIAFSSDATPNNKQQIFIMDEDGNGVMQVCYKDLDCYAPHFSPDGRKIVFNATNVRSDYVYMVNLDDTSTFTLPVFIDGGTNPVFSNDGTMLLYRAEKDDDNAIFIMDIASGESASISDGSLSTHPQFSHDGNKVVYSSSAAGNFDLVVLDLTDTTDNAQKTVASSKDAELYGTFSPSDKLIAYASFDINYKGTVHIYNTEDKKSKTLTSSGSAYNPKFSPDGKYLAFIWEKGGGYDVFIANADGSGVRQLTSGKGNTMEFDWSGDGKKLAFESISEDVSSISVIDVETGKVTDLTGSKANNVNPAFQK